MLYLCRGLASHLVKTLYDLGISAIYSGYPFNIEQGKGNKFAPNMRSYLGLTDVIELEARSIA